MISGRFDGSGLCKRRLLAELDESSERIINCLADDGGVNINCQVPDDCVPVLKTALDGIPAIA